MHQVAVIGKALLAIVLHVTISVRQSRQHGILVDHWLGGFAKSPPMPLFRETLSTKFSLYKSLNNISDVKLIESQSRIKVNYTL